VPGKPSCSPCDATAPAVEPEPCGKCGSEPGERHTWVEGDCVLPHFNHSTNLNSGTFVCRRCTGRWERWLGELVELYATLPDVLLAGSIPDDTAEHGKPKKAPASPSPIRLNVWALLHPEDLRFMLADKDGRPTIPTGLKGIPDVADVLGNWAQAVYDALDWTATAPRTISGATTVLGVNTLTLAAMPDADSFDAELRWVHGALYEAHGLRESSPVGKCPSLDGDGKECGGPLWPDKYGRMQVSCSRCHRTFDERFLSHLGGMLSA